MNLFIVLMFAIPPLLALLSAFSLRSIYKTNGSLRPRTGGQWICAALSVAGVVLAVLIGTQAFRMNRMMSLPRQNIGKNIAAVRLHQVADDAALNLDQYKGKVVLLNYWATW